MEFPSLSNNIIFGIGIFLIAFEIFIPNFVIIWFGIASLIVGLIGLIFEFQNSLHQFALISIIGLILLISLRKRVKSSLLTSSDKKVNDDFLKEGGVGITESEEMINFRGTLWRHNSDKKLKRGERVEILYIKDNIAYLKEQ